MTTRRQIHRYVRATLEFYGQQIGVPEGTLEQHLQDLLTDLMHMAHELDLDFEEMLREARNAFGDEWLCGIDEQLTTAYESAAE